MDMKREIIGILSFAFMITGIKVWCKYDDIISMLISAIVIGVCMPVFIKLTLSD